MTQAGKASQPDGLRPGPGPGLTTSVALRTLFSARLDATEAERLRRAYHIFSLGAGSIAKLMPVALLSWFGTVLGALAMALALSTVPATWAIHHHAVYVFLWVAVIACALIGICVPLWVGSRWAQFRGMVWRAARQAGKGSRPPESDMVVYPRNEVGSSTFSFTTSSASRRLIRTPSRPVGLRITVPVKADIGVVPSPVRGHGKTIFIVSQFLANGFVVTNQSPGIPIKGELSYAELPSAPKAPS